MSGSDPTVRRGPSSLGLGGGGDRDECALSFQTVLGSPDPDVVRDLDPEELLDIEKIDYPVRGVEARRLSGEPVGAITRDIALLRRCIDGGAVYEAEVVELSGGSVTIAVRRR
jgi:hypothetical protein